MCAFVKGDFPEKATITIKSVGDDGKTSEEQIEVLRSLSTDGDLVHQQTAKQLISKLETSKKFHVIAVTVKWGLRMK